MAWHGMVGVRHGRGRVGHGMGVCGRAEQCRVGQGRVL